MTEGVREKILNNLENAPKAAVPEKPYVPQIKEAALDRGWLIDAFYAKFTEQTGIVYKHDPARTVGESLGQIFEEHGIGSIISSDDRVLFEAGLPGSARDLGFEIKTRADFRDRDGFVDAVFRQADAGLTGANFGVAESGTLVLAFDSRHARLISLAPPVHIAVLPADRIVAVYEKAAAEIFKTAAEPSQAVFITGPSMTADIRGTPFKGMHGPRKLIALLV